MIRREQLSIKACLLLTILFLNWNVVGADANKASIQWQRLELETSLKERVSDLANQVVEPDKFFVEVLVETRTPSIGLPSYDLGKKGNKAIEFNDSKKNSNGEYILFDKLGLNAPKYNNGEEQSLEELKLKIFQYEKKVERDFFDKMDIFSNIDSIKIKVGLDKTVEKDKVEKLKKLLDQMIPSFGEVKPAIEVISLDFKIAKSEKSFVQKASWLSWPLGLVLASLLLCLTAYFIFSKYRALSSEAMKKDADLEAEAKEARTESKLPSTDSMVDPKLRPGSSQLADALTETHEGVERFCLYLEKSYDQATNLVKKWINLNSKLANAALVILSERLSVEELYKVFMKLNDDERDVYTKRTTSAELSLNVKNSADKYIGQQVLEDIITVSVTEDKELQTLLVELTPQKAAELVSQYIEEGAVLINMMSGDFLGQMFQFVNVEKTKELTMKALFLKEEDFKQRVESLKATLEQFADKTYKNPFERKVVEVMKELDPQKQDNFLDVLIDAKQFYLIEDIIKTTFPTRLIDKLPGSILKEIFKDMQIDLKVEFLASLDEKRRQNYIRKTTQTGTKGREVIEFELKRVLENEEAMEYVREKKEEIHTHFIKLVQNKIKNDESARKVAIEIAQKWYEEISAGVVNLSSSNDDMDMAA